MQNASSQTQLPAHHSGQNPSRYSAAQRTLQGLVVPLKRERWVLKTISVPLSEDMFLLYFHPSACQTQWDRLLAWTVTLTPPFRMSGCRWWKLRGMCLSVSGCCPGHFGEILKEYKPALKNTPEDHPWLLFFKSFVQLVWSLPSSNNNLLHSISSSQYFLFSYVPIGAFKCSVTLIILFFYACKFLRPLGWLFFPVFIGYTGNLSLEVK